MIHYSRLNLLTEKKDATGRPEPFCFKYVKLATGEIISVENAVVTSSNFERRTRNVMILDSGEVRKLRNCLFIEFNGIPVWI